MQTIRVTRSTRHAGGRYLAGQVIVIGAGVSYSKAEEMVRAGRAEWAKSTPVSRPAPPPAQTVAEPSRAAEPVQHRQGRKRRKSRG